MLVDLSTLDTNFIIDIKYATTNNFTGKKIYQCPKALLRYGAAKDLVLSQQELISKGFV
jgi:D-alanyl-D-alanine dipeptidase